MLTSRVWEYAFAPWKMTVDIAFETEAAAMSAHEELNPLGWVLGLAAR
jgi:hypothetical protein